MNKPLRILHAIRSLNPAGGGPIEGVLQLSTVNIRAGHAVEVVSLDHPSDPWVLACSLPCHALGPAWGKYGYSSRFVSWLREHRDDYDFVVVNGLWQYHAFGVWRALRGTTTPYFVYPHGMLDPWFKRTYPLKHLKKWLYWPWADYRVLRDAAAVLFTCEEERVRARESFALYRCRESVVNYGTAGPVGDPVRQRVLFLEKFPELRGKKCLLFLGRVHVKKGPDLLLRAVAEIRRRQSADLTAQLHVVMAGPDDHAYGTELKTLVTELDLQATVTWTGQVAGDLKWGAFYAAEAFILPSHQENFGIAVVESLACRLPVLISDQVNIWREISADGAGYVEADNLAGTIRLIERWLLTPTPEWEALRQHAEASFQKRFHVNAAAESLVHVARQWRESTAR